MTTTPTVLVTAAAGKTGRHTAQARTFQAGAEFGALSADSETWHATHDPDRRSAGEQPPSRAVAGFAR